MASNFAATTITAAIDRDDVFMNVTSATGFTVGYFAQLGNEMVGIRSISTLRIGINRGANGTKSENHPVLAPAVVGPAFAWQAPVGTGMYYNGGRATNFSAQGYFPTIFPVTVGTATAYTLSVGEILAGFILQDPTGGAVTTTLPTAALLVANVPGCTLGTRIDFTIRNTADAAETITVAAGTGGTVTGGGTMTIAQNAQKDFWIRITGEKVGGEAYIVYSKGSTTF